MLQQLSPTFVSIPTAAAVAWTSIPTCAAVVNRVFRRLREAASLAMDTINPQWDVFCSDTLYSAVSSCTPVNFWARTTLLASSQRSYRYVRAEAEAIIRKYIGSLNCSASSHSSIQHFCGAVSVCLFDSCASPNAMCLSSLRSFLACLRRAG